MKKYLMTVMAAVTLGGLFTGCSKDADINGGANSAEFDIVQNYENAFVTRFGQPAANQTWGFGEEVAGTRSGNTSGDYTPWPSTHQYYDANGKLIASANMNHNQWGSTDLQSMPFGGWIVPDPLTEGQKLRVRMYFQANDKLSYQDPHYANFFVQQVYTGGTAAPETGNHETTVGANGQGHQGMTLNQLTVGQAGSHINDFNAGTCSPSNVLNHEGKTQSDQITLMLNVDDTSCFGFHETSGSNVQASTNHNDKMALVSAADIDAWAAQNGNPGEAVVDKWNRSFMGFDYELLPESDIVTNNYALLSQVPNLNNIPYAWDGQKVMTIGAAPESTQTTKNEDFDLMPYFANHVSGNNATYSTVDGKIVCTFGQYYGSLTFGQGTQDWTPYSKLVIEFEESPINGTVMDTPFSVGDTKVEVALNDVRWWGDNQGPTIVSQDGTLNITKVKLIGKTVEGVTYDPADYYNPTYLLGDADADKIAFYSTNTNMYGGIVLNLTEEEMKTYQDGKTCLNLVKFRQLKNDGYHPITTDLKTWVKWQAACDGYYSDWIVTLTKAERITTTPPPSDPEGFVCRIIAEDLTVGENSDFDFNDVVFDVFQNGVLVIRAIGGELPLYIGSQDAGHEVHAVCGISLTGSGSASKMSNTGWGSTSSTSVAIDYQKELGRISMGRTYSSKAEAKSIPIYVTKKGENILLKADQGKVASKVCVGSDFEWCSEREDIDRKFRKKDYTKLFQQYVIGNLGDDWLDPDNPAWYQLRGK
jgi:hypothetical protein